ncbi:MAG: ribosome small subunit-dependent GTPase A [Clostridia bacterium]
MIGKIIENISNLYKVEVNREIYEATARGKFKNENQTPVVGDNVEIDITDKEKHIAVIEKIIPRKVYIKRPKLANITQIVFVLSSKHPKPDLLMLDKQLAFAEFLGIKSVIVLNKIDLDQKEEVKKIKAIYEKIGYPVIETTAKEKKGIDALIKILKNNINAFSGNSGVGKSTLINGIFDREITQEGEISKRNKRGKNTTTSIKLYEIEQNTYIADTPGFSTFDISEIEYNELEKHFKEFREHIKNCEFVGCTHIKEEKCGIKNAIQEGKISQDRYDRFCKIYEELKQIKERRKW